MGIWDTTTVIGGYNQIIVDWMLGDDRIFNGDAQLATGATPAPNDIDLSDAYFTLKQSINDTDADAIIQVHITQAGSSVGVISAGLNGHLTNLSIDIFSASYQALVNAGTVYYWSIRCISNIAGNTITVASGTIAFLPSATQADGSGQPAVFPNNGNPRFRGFTSANPQTVGGFPGIFNAGDFYMNSNPANGNGSGWQCTIGGSPGTWVVFPAVTFNGFVPALTWSFGTAAPVSGAHSRGEILWLTQPSAGGVIGYSCVASGTPGTWRAFGPISLT